jgi:hypothetical protein
MRLLTLTQPWATLVALGAKRIETRSWGTGYRGDIAIHAGKGLGPVGGALGLQEICAAEHFADALGAHGLTAGDLPRGAVVAVVRLVRCTEMNELGIAELEATQPHEAAFGLYEPGRFAWVLGDLRPLARPYPLRGQLGLREVGASDVEQIERLAVETSVRSAA